MNTKDNYFNEFFEKNLNRLKNFFIILWKYLVLFWKFLIKVKQSIDWTNSHVRFSVIWVATSCMFFIQSIAVFNQMSLELTRYPEPRIENGVSIWGVDLGKTINDLTDSYNTSVSIIEGELKSSARISFIMNMISGFLSLWGLYVQIRQYLEDKTKKNSS